MTGQTAQYNYLCWCAVKLKQTDTDVILENVTVTRVRFEPMVPSLTDN